MTEEQAQKWLDAVQAFTEKLYRCAAPVAGMAMALMHLVKAGLWEEYAKAGCPYGVSEEALFRWFKECAEQ